jgi:uncharacterized protein (UPF0332 family)
MSVSPQAMLQCAEQICVNAGAADEATARAAFSRIYYAAYHACNQWHAALPHPGSVGEAEGVHEQLIAQLRNPGMSEKNRKHAASKALAKGLRILVTYRVQSDYKIAETVEVAKTKDALAKAEEVFETISLHTP